MKIKHEASERHVLAITVDNEAGILAMMAHDGPVIVDCMVAKAANCFPMIPSGAAHTDMILDGDVVAGTMDDEAKALV
jgi:acetolactate synthase-1/2/3 large subunit